MATIRLLLTGHHPIHWVVADDAGRAESFTCPIQAMTRARMRFHQVSHDDMAVLRLSLDGSDGRALLIRDRATRRAQPAHRAGA